MSDLMYGRLGNDTLSGGAGDDFMYGGFDTDILVGGAGNYLLVGEEISAVAAGFPGGGSIGADTLNGGDDIDTAAGMFLDQDFGGVDADTCTNSKILFQPCAGGTDLPDLLGVEEGTNGATNIE